MRRFATWIASLIFALGSLASGSLALAQSTSDAEQTIKNLESQMTQALLKGDFAASEKYLAKDYVRIYPDGTAAPTDDLRNSMTFTVLEISEQQVHVNGETAVSVFRASVKASIGGQPIEGDFRGVRTWAREKDEWKVVAFSTTKIESQDGPASTQETVPESKSSISRGPSPALLTERVHVKDNVLTDDFSKIRLTLDPKFHYLGSFPFDLKGIAGGYRYVWGEVDHGKHLLRAFIVQAEGYYANNQRTYRYGAPNPVLLAGDAYQHTVQIYDNDQSARENPGSESDLTKSFLKERGYEWEPQLVMSRFARVVGETKKDEIILFYFENLVDSTAKRVAEFPEEATSSEHKAILGAVDANSRKAFSVSHQLPKTGG